jgi:glycosyltransferase involved in cell wall biosynthesis
MIKKILIFTATYNEFPNIKTLLKKINSLKINLDILIVDDNSKDGTLAFLTEYSKKNKNLKLIIREKKLGLDTAHKIAYRYAQKNNYNYLVTLDADLSHEPKEIRKFINLLDNNSFIIGSRYIKGGKCDLKGFRFLISFFGNYFISSSCFIICCFCTKLFYNRTFFF